MGSSLLTEVVLLSVTMIYVGVIGGTWLFYRWPIEVITAAFAFHDWMAQFELGEPDGFADEY